jgi:signal transduction histidine kinase
VVDDDEAGRYVKLRALKGFGYEMLEATTGADALRQVAEAQPDIVLLDIRLPDISGLEVCRRIKAEHPSIVVLQTSAAFVRPSDRASALSGGADSYLIEPMEPEELVASVGALLRMRRAEQEMRDLNEALEDQVRRRSRELAEAKGQLASEAEQRAKAEEALRHAQKLDAVGRLTGGIAHDFNNLLTVVLGSLSLMETHLRKPEPVPPERLLKLIAGSRKAVQDCEGLTRQLLAFARRDPLRVETVDLNRTLAEYEGFMKGVVGEKVSLEIAFGPNLWPLLLDARQLEASILNLAINARDAMPEAGGKLCIESENLDLPVALPPISGVILRPEEIPAGQYVHIKVRDSGSGMTPDVLNLVFEPFFTTKEVGKGSGLGLSQVHGFVKQSQGYVSISSRPTGGTTVDLYFPRASGIVAAGDKREMVEEVPKGQETILIVEDDARVRDTVEGMIESLGYHVLRANNGPHALEVLEETKEVALMFTDIVMPAGMTGVDLAREAKRRRPDLKVLLTSGFAGGREGKDPPINPGRGEFSFLPKPYTVLELARHFRTLLHPVG